MPFKYSCFISFKHGRRRLSKAIVEQLLEALESEIELITDHEIFIDWEKIKGGDLYEKVLSNALCQSACMVLVYTPSYFNEKSTFCAREYQAMEILEKYRLRLLNSSTTSKHGLIIPVVFRGEERLPNFIRDRRHYYDFQSFSLSSSKISEHPEFSRQIKELAKYICDRLDDLSSLSEDVCKDCDGFSLPTEQDASAWVKSFAQKPVSFPRL